MCANALSIYVSTMRQADVNGPGTRPTYKFLKEKGVLGDIAWNFAGAALNLLWHLLHLFSDPT